MDTKSETIKPDYRVINGIIAAGSSVLDLGCGEGDLLQLLVKEKQVRAQGIEIDDEAIYKCVAKGLSVFNSDIDSGLPEFADKSFDFVILNQSLQQVNKPDVVLKEALRVGRKVIVGFPNFAHWRSRFQMFFTGRTPVTASLPYKWHDTPNRHSLSILDFFDYCKKRGIKIEGSFFIGKKGKVLAFPNFFAQTGIFVISKNGVRS
jgi:methionine biosynthesis protein MetW